MEGAHAIKIPETLLLFCIHRLWRCFSITLYLVKQTSLNLVTTAQLGSAMLDKTARRYGGLQCHNTKAHHHDFAV